MPMERASYGCWRAGERELGEAPRRAGERELGGAPRRAGERELEEHRGGLESESWRGAGERELEGGPRRAGAGRPTRPTRPGVGKKKRAASRCGIRSSYRFGMPLGQGLGSVTGMDYSCSPVVSASSIFSRSSARASRSPRVDFSAGAEVVALLLTFTSEGVASTLSPLAASS